MTVYIPDKLCQLWIASMKTYMYSPKNSAYKMVPFSCVAMITIWNVSMSLLLWAGRWWCKGLLYICLTSDAYPSKLWQQASRQCTASCEVCPYHWCRTVLWFSALQVMLPNNTSLMSLIVIYLRTREAPAPTLAQKITKFWSEISETGQSYIYRTAKY